MHNRITKENGSAETRDCTQDVVFDLDAMSESQVRGNDARFEDTYKLTLSDCLRAVPPYGPTTFRDFDLQDEVLVITLPEGETKAAVTTRPTGDRAGTEVLFGGSLCATLPHTPGLRASDINLILS